MLVQQLKIVRYLEKYQQVYKEKYVKVQTNRLRYYGFDTSSTSKGAYTGLKRQTTLSRNNTLTFFLKLVLFYEGYLDRYEVALAVVQSNVLNIFINMPFFQRVNIVVYSRALKLIQVQKDKLRYKLEQRATNDNFTRPPYISLFTQTISLPCSYKLEGKDTLELAIYDTFQLILGIVIEGPATRRILEAIQQLKKRLVQVAKLYTTSIGASSNQRNLILIERLNLNNYNTIPLDILRLNDIAVAYRNSKPQRVIQ